MYYHKTIQFFKKFRNFVYILSKNGKIKKITIYYKKPKILPGITEITSISATKFFASDFRQNREKPTTNKNRNIFHKLYAP